MSAFDERLSYFCEIANWLQDDWYTSLLQREDVSFNLFIQNYSTQKLHELFEL